MKPLTRREKEICGLVVRGFTSAEIARQTGISPRTVDDHRHAVMVKYGARNVVELVRTFFDIPDDTAT